MPNSIQQHFFCEFSKAFYIVSALSLHNHPIQHNIEIERIILRWLLFLSFRKIC